MRLRIEGLESFAVNEAVSRTAVDTAGRNVARRALNLL